MNRYRVFLSYRRSDSRNDTGRFRDELARLLPNDLAFFDADSIDPGVPFLDAMAAAIAGSALVIVVIGAGWADARAANGTRRLDDPNDPVRFMGVRKRGVSHYFSWRDVDLIDTYSTASSLFLIAREVDDRLRDKYSRLHGWPRWDAGAGHLVICDLKVRAHRSSGGKGGSVSFVVDRYSGGDGGRVLQAVQRYRPVGGFGGLPDPRPVPGRDRRHLVWLGVAVMLALVTTVVAASVAESTDTWSVRGRFGPSAPPKLGLGRDDGRNRHVRLVIHATATAEADTCGPFTHFELTA